MRTADRSTRRERGVVLATAGLLLALGVGWGLQLLGFSDVSGGQWFALLGLTLFLQSLLWLISRLGLYAHISWDPRFIYLPMVTAITLINLYLYMFPEIRDVVVMGWFASLLFLAGVAGLVDVILLSGLMAIGYLVTVGLLASRGAPITMTREFVVAGVIVLIGIFAGLVLDGLRRTGKEARRLRAELDRQAHTDYLTDLPNRRQFEAVLATEMTRVRRYGGTCALGVMDVDWFKDYNDRYGHLAGDEALRQLGSIMRDELRVGDLAARYGGEEFALIMLNTGDKEAVQVLDRLRQAVARHRFPGAVGEDDVQLTISGGVAVFRGDIESSDRLIQAADRALYQAKAGGRNRIVGMSEEEAETIAAGDEQGRPGPGD